MVLVGGAGHERKLSDRGFMSVSKKQRNSLARSYDDGRVEAHLLMTGFMDGYTRWIIDMRMMKLRTPTGQAMTTWGKTKR